MTLEELKKEAKAAGYNLIPIPKTEKLLPCLCGRKRRQTVYNGKTKRLFLVCPGCGYKAMGENDKEVRENWNKGIRDQMEAKA